MARQPLKRCFHWIGLTGVFFTGRDATSIDLVGIWSMILSIWKSKSLRVDGAALRRQSRKSKRSPPPEACPIYHGCGDVTRYKGEAPLSRCPRPEIAARRQARLTDHGSGDVNAHGDPPSPSFQLRSEIAVSNFEWAKAAKWVSPNSSAIFTKFQPPPSPPNSINLDLHES